MQSIAAHQAANPEYSFLHGGPGADYYAYVVQHYTRHAQQAQLATAAAVPAAAPAAAATPAAAAAEASSAAAQQAGANPALDSLPVEVSGGWQQVLALLNGSRDSIRKSQVGAATHTGLLAG